MLRPFLKRIYIAVRNTRVRGGWVHHEPKTGLLLVTITGILGERHLPMTPEHIQLHRHQLNTATCF